jgi:hypothetical protein
MTGSPGFLSPKTRRRMAVAALCLLAAFPATLQAGGGPEGVLVVVNPQSPASMAIANHYVHLRRIPDGNVLHLPWDPKQQTTDVEAFRQKILGPILSAIEARGLAGQIDCVAYSSDFPWAVNAQPDVNAFLKQAQEAQAQTGPRSQKASEPDSQRTSQAGKDAPAQPQPKPPALRSWPAVFQATCSLNGLTYLYRPVTAGNPAAYLAMSNNQYMRRAVPQQKDAPTLAFGAALRFGPHGDLVESGGASYLLSVMLGVTAGRGNTVPEVLDYLQRSAEADGMHPKGTIYFCQNGDIRSRIRQRAFPEAVKQLNALGVAAEILDGVLPPKKKDVQGAMIGAADFDWKASGSTILPGAICEHLTSFGGIMSAGAGQTPLSAFLRCGAAGASGTVVEPFAIQDKFPLAMIHVHYARGCTLAEAFYQSVFGPFQLLIVGDPLCRPWANIPAVAVEGVQPGAAVKGTLTLAATATVPGGGKVDRFELFVDGLRGPTAKPGEPLLLDTLKLGDGHHELRVVAIEAGPIRSQGRRIVPIVIANHGRRLDVSLSPLPRVPADGRLTVTAKCPGAASIAVFHNADLLGTIAAAEGRVEIDARRLGSGPARLRTVARGNAGPESNVYGPTVEVNVADGPK